MFQPFDDLQRILGPDFVSWPLIVFILAILLASDFWVWVYEKIKHMGE